MVSVRVVASNPWNQTGQTLTQGHRYQFTVPVGQSWKDSYIECGPTGYADRFIQWLGRPWLRVKKLNGVSVPYFALIGTVGKRLDHAFVIGTGCQWVSPTEGELVCFANDVPGFYWNNRGEIEVQVDDLGG